MSFRPTVARRPALRLSACHSKKAYCIVAISKDLLEGSLCRRRPTGPCRHRGRPGRAARRSPLARRAHQLYPQGLLTHPDITKTPMLALVNADLPATILARVMARKVKFSAADAGWRFNHSIWLQFYNLKNDLGVYEFRDEMDRGMLAGYPYKVTTLIPNASGGDTRPPTSSSASGPSCSLARPATSASS